MPGQVTRQGCAEPRFAGASVSPSPVLVASTINGVSVSCPARGAQCGCKGFWPNDEQDWKKVLIGSSLPHVC